MRWAVVFLSCFGCSSILGIEEFKLGDAGGDGIDPDALTGYCLGPTGFRVCLPAEPTTAPTNITSSLTLDTVSSPLCAGNQPPSWKALGQPDACFLISTQVTFGAPIVQVTGGRPLVVFASDSITVTTQLDVASHGAVRGPAAPSAACTAPMAAGNGSGTASAGGGGAGGTFMGKGGNGGMSSNNVIGGVASPVGAAPTLLRAGCSGGVGGNGQNGAMGGAPGTGGGAVYLVAANRITINGFINASGSGGVGGQILAGGGGGGSGGMILLHAPAISGNGGVVLANGGGGGGGGSGNTSGFAGADPSTTNPTQQAAGGAGGGPGGVGFAGTANATNGQNGSPTSANAGGAGGGGGGYIRSNIPLSQITSSPAATVIP